jgi:RNA polymerase sigma-70 factor (ECF subfamily)
MTGTAMRDALGTESTVRRAAAGNEAAYVRLEHEHYAPMVRAAYVITGDAELAREATQIAWTKAWHRLGSLHQPDRVRSWLVAIAANEARQLIRGEYRRAVHETAAPQDDPDRSDPAWRIELMDLKRAVRRLPPDEQSLLSMRFAAGLDSSQIGEQSGMSASGVRSRIARILERLRIDLDDA